MDDDGMDGDGMDGELQCRKLRWLRIGINGWVAAMAGVKGVASAAMAGVKEVAGGSHGWIKYDAGGGNGWATSAPSKCSASIEETLALFAPMFAPYLPATQMFLWPVTGPYKAL